MAATKSSKSRAPSAQRILVIDVGGSHVKFLVGRRGKVKIESGPRMDPRRMVRQIRQHIENWRCEAVSIGYPGVVKDGRITHNPHNLGKGWKGFDFRKAFGMPVKVINDAAMQALGAYRGGTMLFLGLGTGLGTTLIVDQTVVPMELAHLHLPGDDCTFESLVGDAARQNLGNVKWRRHVGDLVHALRDALLPDDIVIGGGNVKHLKRMPPHTRRGDNDDAFKGGLRLWTRKPESR
jgi:predicted NBD/HSP70 family sugar kinase